MTTKMEKPRKTKEEEITFTPAPALEEEIDASLCRCEGVQRRWDTDGLIEKGLYRCSVCGKGYR